MKPRNLIVFTLAFIMLAPVIVYAGGIESQIEAYVNYVNLVVDGEEMEVDTIIYESTTYVPIRAVAEFFGKDVSWDDETKTASIDDYPFLLVDDDLIVGKWESVDYVNNFGEFNVDDKYFPGELYLTGIDFTSSNKVAFEIKNKLSSYSIEFIGDVIINSDDTANRFYVQLIDDNYYMFYEWDHSDGIHKDMTPDYYVLKKVEDEQVVTGLEDLAK